MLERQLCAQQGAKSLPGIKALGTHKKPTHAGSIVIPLYRRATECKVLVQLKTSLAFTWCY